MNFFINRKVVEGPWGGGNNFVRAIYDYIPDDDYTLIEDPYRDIPDVIFLQSPKPDNQCNFSINEAIAFKNKYPNIQIILRVNECDLRKETSGVDHLWIESSKHVDKTIFVSNWMKNYFSKKEWQCKQNFVVYNGANLDHFKENEKINNGKINIVTHHWSNNRMKGFDMYEEIDKFVNTNKDYTFTYIGRELGTFKNTNVITPLFGKELGEELGKYDVYISASKFDPGPNHILESIACGIPTYSHFEGGGSCEFTGEAFTFNNFNTLKDILHKNSHQKNALKVTTWKNCIMQIKSVIHKGV